MRLQALQLLVEVCLDDIYMVGENVEFVLGQLRVPRAPVTCGGAPSASIRSSQLHPR